MTNARAGFELELQDAWGRRDFAAWLDCRRYYADWLEEAGDPLAGMARAPCSVYECTVCTKGGPRVWLWRLTFGLPKAASEWPRSRWPRNRRMNGARLLGFPPTTLRCMAVEDGVCARFSATFKPRAPGHWKSNRRLSLSGRTWQSAALDTDLHPAGFARLFWPHGWEVPAGEPEGQAEPSLFDALP